MKNFKLTPFLVAFGIVFLMSLSYNQAGQRTKAYSSIVYTVPIKPKSTVIVYGIADVKSLLKKGYQVQEAWNNNNHGDHLFVMVKY